MTDRPERRRYYPVDEWREFKLERWTRDKVPIGTPTAKTGTSKTSGKGLINFFVRFCNLVMLKINEKIESVSLFKTALTYLPIRVIPLYSLGTPSLEQRIEWNERKRQV